MRIERELYLSREVTNLNSERKEINKIWVTRVESSYPGQSTLARFEMNSNSDRKFRVISQGYGERLADVVLYRELDEIGFFEIDSNSTTKFFTVSKRLKELFSRDIAKFVGNVQNPEKLIVFDSDRDYLPIKLNARGFRPDVEFRLNDQSFSVAPIYVDRNNFFTEQNSYDRVIESWCVIPSTPPAHDSADTILSIRSNQVDGFRSTQLLYKEGYYRRNLINVSREIRGKSSSVECHLISDRPNEETVDQVQLETWLETEQILGQSEEFATFWAELRQTWTGLLKATLTNRASRLSIQTSVTQPKGLTIEKGEFISELEKYGSGLLKNAFTTEKTRNKIENAIKQIAWQSTEKQSKTIVARPRKNTSGGQEQIHWQVKIPGNKNRLEYADLPHLISRWRRETTRLIISLKTPADAELLPAMKDYLSAYCTTGTLLMLEVRDFSDLRIASWNAKKWCSGNLDRFKV